MTDVLVFAPSPLLTITVEQLHEHPEVHLHAGGQGFWLARMLNALGTQVRLCGTFGGETGAVVRALIEREGVEVRAVEVDAPNGVYVHDRRNGERTPIVEERPVGLTRHDVDSFYNAALVEGLEADVCVLGGPGKDMPFPNDVYARLAADWRSNGHRVVADLGGPPLAAVLDAGLDVLKVSSVELVQDGFADDEDDDAVLAALPRLHQGATAVVVSRADRPAMLSVDDEVLEVPGPTVRVVDEHGGGDALTAGLVAGMAQGLDLRQAVRLGVAAGSLNVTRHGLATGSVEDILRMTDQIQLNPLRRTTTPSVSLDELAQVKA